MVNHVLYPASTPTHTFDIPFAADYIEKVLVSYKQRGSIVLAKEVTSFTDSATEENVCSFAIPFTQEETLKFANNQPIMAQLNIFTTDDKRLTSDPIEIEAGDQYERRVIT